MIDFLSGREVPLITATIYYVLVIAFPAKMPDGSQFLNTSMSIHKSDNECSEAGKIQAAKRHGSWACHPLLVQPSPAAPGFDIKFTME